MTGSDLVIFFEDLLFDLAHPGDANLAWLAARVVIVLFTTIIVLNLTRGILQSLWFAVRPWFAWFGDVGEVPTGWVRERKRQREAAERARIQEREAQAEQRRREREEQAQQAKAAEEADKKARELAKLRDLLSLDSGNKKRSR